MGNSASVWNVLPSEQVKNLPRMSSQYLFAFWQTPLLKDFAFSNWVVREVSTKTASSDFAGECCSKVETGSGIQGHGVLTSYLDTVSLRRYDKNKWDSPIH